MDWIGYPDRASGRGNKWLRVGSDRPAASLVHVTLLLARCMLSPVSCEEPGLVDSRGGTDGVLHDASAADSDAAEGQQDLQNEMEPSVTKAMCGAGLLGVQAAAFFCGHRKTCHKDHTSKSHRRVQFVRMHGDAAADESGHPTRTSGVWSCTAIAVRVLLLLIALMVSLGAVLLSLHSSQGQSWQISALFLDLFLESTKPPPPYSPAIPRAKALLISPPSQYPSPVPRHPPRPSPFQPPCMPPPPPPPSPSPLPPPSAPSAPSTPRWQVFTHVNCYSGHGSSNDIDGSGHLVATLLDCKALCLAREDCEAFVVTRGLPLQCYRRGSVLLSQCERFQWVFFDLYTLAMPPRPPGAPQAPPGLPSPPPPPLPPQSALVQRLNQRFRDGQPSSNLMQAGILVHVDDGAVGSDGRPRDAFVSASIVSDSYGRLFNGGGAGGYILNPGGVIILCSWSVDGGTHNRRCRGGVPGCTCPGHEGERMGWCGPRGGYCPYPPLSLEWMLRNFKTGNGPAYNEVIVSPLGWSQSPVRSVEATYGSVHIDGVPHVRFSMDTARPRPFADDLS